MHVWAVANQKGGVGKTTTAVSLAGLLANEGKRVLLIDLDPHGSMTAYFQYDPESLSQSTFDLFMDGGKVHNELIDLIIQPTSNPSIQLLPASTALATLERKVSNQGGMGLVISKTLAQLWDSYDYALIDTPPVLGVLMINALAAAQKLLIPVQTEFLAIKGLERMIHTLDMVIKSRKNELPYIIIPTLYDRRTQASVQSLKSLRSIYPDHIWDESIPVDTKFRDASRVGKTPTDFDRNSRGIRSYQHLLQYILDFETKAASI